MAEKVRKNISLDVDVFEEFTKVAEKKGMKLSTWVNSEMKKFIKHETGRVF